jgi:hypothetical protein
LIRRTWAAAAEREVEADWAEAGWEAAATGSAAAAREGAAAARGWVMESVEEGMATESVEVVRATGAAAMATARSKPKGRG